MGRRLVQAQRPSPLSENAQSASINCWVSQRAKLMPNEAKRQCMNAAESNVAEIIKVGLIESNGAQTILSKNSE